MTEQENTILETTLTSDTSESVQPEQAIYSTTDIVSDKAVEEEVTVSETFNKLVELNDEMAQSITNLEKVLTSSKELQNALASTNNVLFGDLINSLNAQIDEYSNQHSRLVEKKARLEHVISSYNIVGYEDAVESLSFIFGLLK